MVLFYSTVQMEVSLAILLSDTAQHVVLQTGGSLKKEISGRSERVAFKPPMIAGKNLPVQITAHLGGSRGESATKSRLCTVKQQREDTYERPAPIDRRDRQPCAEMIVYYITGRNTMDRPSRSPPTPPLSYYLRPFRKVLIM